jgi:hypothetical protein
MQGRTIEALGAVMAVIDECVYSVRAARAMIHRYEALAIAAVSAG